VKLFDIVHIDLLIDLLFHKLGKMLDKFDFRVYTKIKRLAI